MENTREAFESEWRAHETRILGWCVRLTGNRADGEDLLMDTAVKALLAWPKFEWRSAFTSWCCRIASNAAKDRAKKPSNRPTKQLDDTVPSPVRLDESVIQSETLSQALTHIKAELPHGIYAVWAGWYLDGFQYNEIAEILSIPEGTVKSRLFRSRRMVTAILSTHGIEA